MMILNLLFVSLTATLALTSVIANPLPSGADQINAELEARGDWHYPKTHRVIVGAGGKFRYDPEYVSAKIGDYIKFELRSDEFVLGSVPVPPGTKHFPTKVFKVADDKPHWFYCGQTGHCADGMVFAVNPPHKGNTFHKFRETAKSSGK
ncbi:RmlC-like cupin [Rhizoctonia solani]|uniref:RmlC-like cupin n=1 Tax=Rhizoctonia solani TaxID=456999 RepID=A0A8H7I661_9AGAM|nr:RmlC-like cupin [Rhizoctonia solani]